MIATGLLLIALLVGCTSGGLARTQIVRHPDAPMLITQARGTARVSVFDAQTRTLIDAGSVDLSTLEGWTISKYDWERVTMTRDPNHPGNIK